MEFYVYVYTDPVTKLPFYVGKGQAGRYRDHLSYTHNRFLKSKIAKIRKDGFEPQIDIVFRSTDEDLVYDIEEHLIKSYGIRNDGGLLCNFSIGGRGNRKYALSDAHLDLMGNITDEELAAMVGCTRSNISHIRRGLGVPACEEKPNYSPPPPMGGWNKIDIPQDCLELIGTMPDRKLAEMFGFSKYVISRYRDKHGIPSYASTHGNPTRFKKQGKQLLDKTVRKFRNVETGEVWEGIRMDFANFLGVSSNLLGGLIRGRNKTSYGWELVKDE